MKYVIEKQVSPIVGNKRQSTGIRSNIRTGIRSNIRTGIRSNLRE